MDRQSRGLLRTGIILGAIILAGCVSKKGNLFTEPTQPLNKIPMSGFDLVLEDLRKNVTKGPMKIPSISFPGQKREIEPAITEGLEPSLREILTSYRSWGDRQLLFRVEIIEGIARFDANIWSEEEYVLSRIKLTVTDALSGDILAASTGKGEGFRKSMDASPRRVQEMFLASIKVALKQALESTRIRPSSHG